jgi:hypothetical protein
MKWRKWLEEWGMSGLKINTGFLEMEWKPMDEDRDAAWELYAELLTRVTTQALPAEDGNEKAALDSVFSLFPTTREIMKRQGRHAREFTKIAIIVLNQIVRPFTAKWHKRQLDGKLQTPEERQEFREDLAKLQPRLVTYAQMLSEMAGVEDLTALEDPRTGPPPQTTT